MAIDVHEIGLAAAQMMERLAESYGEGAELAFGYAEMEEPREVRYPEARAEMQGTRETPGEAA